MSAPSSAMTLPGAMPSVPLTVPPLDPMSAGAPHITTGADVASEARSLRRKHHPGGPNPGSAAQQMPHAGAAPPPGQDPQKTPGSGEQEPLPGCGSGVGISQLLSPACLETLRARQVPAGTGAGTAVPPPAGMVLPGMAQPSPEPVRAVPCAVVIFGARGGAVTPPVFTAGSTWQCIEMGVRMSYGVPGATNITAADPQWGVVAVTCRRPPPDGTSAECSSQQ